MTLNNSNSEKKSINTKIAIFIATGFGSGYSPFASGTAGSAVAVVLSLLMVDLWNGFSIIGLSIVLGFCFIGLWSADIAESVFGKKDDGRVVIDEIAGYFVSIFMLPKTIPIVIAGFLIFRVFDIIKPFPANSSQQLKGGVGIMADDIIAGIYTNLVIRIALFFL